MDVVDKRGYFSTILAFDVETTGINFENKSDCSEGYQIVSIGVIVADANSYEVIEKKYVEIQWDGVSRWSPKAEEVHGLTKEYLEVNGVSEEDAVVVIGEMILKYWPLNSSINALGHNLVGFDIIFLRNLFTKYGMVLNFGNRHVDTFTLMKVLLDEYNSEDGFQRLGMPARTAHNALEDIEYTLETVRRLKLLWNTKIGV